LSYLYAIGDVHGRLDLLTEAFAVIDDHAGGRPSRVITLGDYIDRGPDSAGVIALLRARQAERDLICLKGNHEALMVEALRTGAYQQWFRGGGEMTLGSYGDAPSADDLAWMDSLPVVHREGERLFVHAGLEPDVPLAEQDPQVMMWIRDRFLEAGAETLPGHVVHAHTPVWAAKPDPEIPERLPHRTNLDTRAWETGILSIGVFDPKASGGPLYVLSARGPVGHWSL